MRPPILIRDAYVNIADLQALIDIILQYQVDRFPQYSVPMVFVELDKNADPLSDELVVPLQAVVNVEAAAFEFSVAYNPEKLEVIEVTPSDMISNLRLDYHVANGRIERRSLRFDREDIWSINRLHGRYPVPRDR